MFLQMTEENSKVLQADLPRTRIISLIPICKWQKFVA
jgi:hypothetical protein